MQNTCGQKSRLLRPANLSTCGDVYSGMSRENLCNVQANSLDMISLSGVHKHCESLGVIAGQDSKSKMHVRDSRAFASLGDLESADNDLEIIAHSSAGETAQSFGLGQSK
jgi:hypothetical protein